VADIPLAWDRPPNPVDRPNRLLCEEITASDTWRPRHNSKAGNTRSGKGDVVNRFELLKHLLPPTSPLQIITQTIFSPSIPMIPIICELACVEAGIGILKKVLVFRMLMGLS